MRTRRRFLAEFKSKVALEAINGQETVAELATKHELHSSEFISPRLALLRSAPLRSAPLRSGWVTWFSLRHAFQATTPFISCAT